MGKGKRKTRKGPNGVPNSPREVRHTDPQDFRVGTNGTGEIKKPAPQPEKLDLRRNIPGGTLAPPPPTFVPGTDLASAVRAVTNPEEAVPPPTPDAIPAPLPPPSKTEERGDVSAIMGKDLLDGMDDLVTEVKTQITDIAAQPEGFDDIAPKAPAPSIITDPLFVAPDKAGSPMEQSLKAIADARPTTQPPAAVTPPPIEEIVADEPTRVNIKLPVQPSAVDTVSQPKVEAVKADPITPAEPTPIALPSYIPPGASLPPEVHTWFTLEIPFDLVSHDVVKKVLYDAIDQAIEKAISDREKGTLASIQLAIDTANNMTDLTHAIQLLQRHRFSEKVKAIIQGAEQLLSDKAKNALPLFVSQEKSTSPLETGIQEISEKRQATEISGSASPPSEEIAADEPTRVNIRIPVQTTVVSEPKVEEVKVSSAIPDEPAPIATKAPSSAPASISPSSHPWFNSELPTDAGGFLRSQRTFLRCISKAERVATPEEKPTLESVGLAIENATDLVTLTSAIQLLYNHKFSEQVKIVVLKTARFITDKATIDANRRSFERLHELLPATVIISDSYQVLGHQHIATQLIVGDVIFDFVFDPNSFDIVSVSLPAHETPMPILGKFSNRSLTNEKTVRKLVQNLQEFAQRPVTMAHRNNRQAALIALSLMAAGGVGTAAAIYYGVNHSGHSPSSSSHSSTSLPEQRIPERPSEPTPPITTTISTVITRVAPIPPPTSSPTTTALPSPTAVPIAVVPTTVTVAAETFSMADRHVARRGREGTMIDFLRHHGIDHRGSFNIAGHIAHLFELRYVNPMTSEFRTRQNASRPRDVISIRVENDELVMESLRYRTRAHTGTPISIATARAPLRVIARMGRMEVSALRAALTSTPRRR